MNDAHLPQPAPRPWYQVAAIAFAVIVLLACKIVEEVHIEKDGSGVYTADLTLVGEEKEMLSALKEELAKKPEIKIVDEGPRGDDYFLAFEMSFAEVSELSDDSSTYAWSASKEGLFTHKVRLEISNRGSAEEQGADEHRLEVTMPGKVVDSNADKVSGRTIVWDRLAAGSDGKLYIEAEYRELPAEYRGKIIGVAAVLLVGIALLAILRIRRKR